MILPKYKFDKIKPYIRNSVPTGLYVLMKNQYETDQPLSLEDYVNLFVNYCDDRDLNNLKKDFKKILNIDLKINGHRLPFMKPKEEVLDGDSRSDDNINSIKYKHKITTSFTNSDKIEKREVLDNRKIEKLIKSSVKPEEIDIDNLFNSDKM